MIVDLIKLDIIQERIKETALKKQHGVDTIKYLVEPLIEMLGYDLKKDVDVNFSKDFRFNDDGGIDFTLYDTNSNPVLTIEAKIFDTSLRRFEGLGNRIFNSQLETTKKILTDGRFCFFFKDSLFEGLVDDNHYYRVDLLDVSEQDIEELSKLTKAKIR